MMVKKSKVLTLVLSLVLALTLVSGCAKPAVPAATQPAPAPATQQPATPAPAPSADANILKWADWKAKMTGAINKDYYVVDLRTVDEIKLEKALEGAINIDATATIAKGDLAVIDEKLKGVSKDAVLLIHCKSGLRAKANLAKFIEKGYKNTYALDGWTAFDAKGYIGAAKITAASEQLKADAWQAKMVGTIGKDYFVIDARDKAEFEAGHLKGALNFGVRDQLTVDHAATLANVGKAITNKDALILVHCAVGSRAKVAQAHLKAEGYSNVLALDAKATIDKDGNAKYE